MKYSKTLLLLGIWFFVIPFLGIPGGIKKLLLVIPALLLIMIGITRIRNEKKSKDQLSSTNEELIHEIAENLAEDIVEEANINTNQELKKLKDIL